MTTPQHPSLHDRLASLANSHSSRPKLPPGHPLDSKWERLLLQEPKKLFNPDGTIRFDYLQEFRRREIFVSDMAPASDFANVDPRAWWKELLAHPIRGLRNLISERLLGSRRGARQLLNDVFKTLEAEGALDLLHRHPAAGTPGAPFTYQIDGYSFNLRWARHIYFHNLLRRHLGDEIRQRDRFISMDIGSSYGIFPSIFKAEYPNSTHVLVDFPDQHILAYYYLASTFPDARIATLNDLLAAPQITREFLAQFDFVLAPVAMYDMFAANSVDMVTNFFSFGEMRREWFMSYLDSAPFRTAEFLFTSNRIESAPRHEPTYDSDLTILDYRLSDYEKLFFGVFPLYPYHIGRKLLFSYDKLPFSSPNFDFIGRRR
ncbi:MAG: putative sugar O-methyltransferase [Burkholderiales bacterium]